MKPAMFGERRAEQYNSYGKDKNQTRIALILSNNQCVLMAKPIEELFNFKPE
jgi:hypothetical protein